MAPILKHRTLRIADGDSGAVAAACRGIAALPGVAVVNVDGCKLRVAYDLLQVGLAQVELAAEDAGVVFRNGLHGLRRDLWKFTEQNERDNAAHAGTRPCCSRPPTRLK